MQPRSLAQWLAYIETVHPSQIDMGLDRVRTVAERLGFTPPAFAPAPRSVIVAGTNGKGSTCIFTEALLLSAGLRVGTTLSPHLHRFNERVRVDGVPLADGLLCEAFERVEAARAGVALTYFEFSALVALERFRAAEVDVAVLEVGLGGRLDAFNLVSADVAAVTSIGLDHQDYLGNDLESIGREKAGVMRPGQAVVLGGDVTDSVTSRARDLGCRVQRAGETFHVRLQPDCWSYDGAAGAFRDLPWGSLAPENCAIGIEVAAHFTPIDGALVARAIQQAVLAGRCESRAVSDQLVVLDVAHNPAGAAFLCRQLRARYPGRRFRAVLGMLADKDAAGVVEALAPVVSEWICISTPGPRGLSATALMGRLPRGTAGRTAANASEALDIALQSAALPSAAEGGILAVGSFSAVGQVGDCLDSRAAR
jgi:dihydrofolate synthase/folylpolyglutamate synthase